MPSQYFSIEPTTGAGRGNIYVYNTVPNYTDQARYATLVVSTGFKNISISVKQDGLPSITQVSGSSTVQGAGGTLPYIVKTDYDFVFQNVPTFVTIRDASGNTYTQGQRIAASAATNNIFYVDVAANGANSQRTSGDFNMGHYLSSTPAQRTAPITFTQLPNGSSSGSTPYLIVDPVNVYLSYVSADTAQVTVTSNRNWTITNNATHMASASPTAGTPGETTVNVSAIWWNSSDSFNRTGTMTVKTSDNALTETFNVIQGYEPTIEQVGGSTTVPQTGSTLIYTIHTEYDVVFQNVPSYVTIKDASGNTYTQGQRIAAEVANNNLFRITVPRNETGVDRTSGDFNMGHYINNTLSTRTRPIFFKQTAEHSIPISACCDLDVAYSENWYSVNITSLGEWTTYSAPYWAFPSPSAGTGDREVIVHVLDNSSTLAREDTIVFETLDNIAVIAVRQSGAPMTMQTIRTEEEETMDDEGTEEEATE